MSEPGEVTMGIGMPLADYGLHERKVGRDDNTQGFASNAVCNPVSPPVIGVKTEAAKANDICAKARVKIEKYIPERRSEINPIISAKIPATAVEIIMAGITFMVSSFNIQTPA